MSQAAIEGYIFESVQGKDRTVTAPAEGINPQNNFHVSVSGGLDRKVRVSLVNTAGEIQESITTSYISIDDRINFDGKEFYGKSLQLNSPSDGEFTVKADLLDAKDSVLTSWEDELIIDTVPPTYGDFTWAFNYAGTDPAFSINGESILWSRVEARHLTLNNVHDSHGGLSGEYEYIYLDGPKAGQTALAGVIPYYPDSHKLMLGSGSVSTVPFPSGSQAKMKVRFVLGDLAGNKSTAEKEFFQQGTCSTGPEFVAYYDPDFSGKFLGQDTFHGFRPHDGSPVPIKQNPFKSIYKWPKSKHRGSSEGAIYGGFPIVNHGYMKTIHYEDSEFVYFIIDSTVSKSGYYNYTQNGWTNRYTWRCGKLYVPNPQFSESAIPPVSKSADGYIDGYGWLASGYVDYNGTLPYNTKISTIRYKTEPRVYDQTAGSGGSWGQCVIAAGDSYCDAVTALDINLLGTASHHHTRPPLTDTLSGTMRSEYSLLWDWDASAPTVDFLVSHNEDSKEVEFKATELYSGASWNRKKMRESKLIAVNKSNNQEVNILAEMKSSGNDYWISASYESLPDGIYQIDGWVHDNYHMEDRKTLINEVVVDSTAPSISIAANGQTSFSHVSGLESIVVTLADPNDPVITSARLTGGPGNDDIYLAYRTTGNDQWVLEYPRIFPSLEEGESYTLEVEAADKFYNSSSDTARFTYSPPDLLNLGVLSTFAVTSALKLPDDQPLNMLVTDPLRTEEGYIARGEQAGVVTLRSDAEYPIMILGQIVNPGQTVEVKLQPESDGSLSVPIYPSVPGQSGSADFMLELPQITTTFETQPAIKTPIYSCQSGYNLNGNQCSGQEWRYEDPITIVHAELLACSSYTQQTTVFRHDSNSCSYNPVIIQTPIESTREIDGQNLKDEYNRYASHSSCTNYRVEGNQLKYYRYYTEDCNYPYYCYAFEQKGSCGYLVGDQAGIVLIAGVDTCPSGKQCSVSNAPNDQTTSKGCPEGMEAYADQCRAVESISIPATVDGYNYSCPAEGEWTLKGETCERW